MKMLTNLITQVGKIKRDGKKTHTCFYLEKMREEDVGKKKSTTLSLAFPFSLNQNKARQLFRKSRYALSRIWNKEDLINWVSRMFPN